MIRSRHFHLCKANPQGIGKDVKKSLWILKFMTRWQVKLMLMFISTLVIITKCLLSGISWQGKTDIDLPIKRFSPSPKVYVLPFKATHPDFFQYKKRLLSPIWGWWWQWEDSEKVCPEKYADWRRIDNYLDINTSKLLFLFYRYSCFRSSPYCSLSW